MAKEQSEYVLSKFQTADFNINLHVPDYVLNPDMSMPTIEIDGYVYVGTIQLPTLNIELPVMNNLSNQGLKISPCLYSGSIYKENAVIAAHNYINHFGKLVELSQGDKILFTDLDNNVFIYEVISTEVLIPTAVIEMIENEADLSLFTCTIGGSYRFTVRCKLIETNSFLNM